MASEKEASRQKSSSQQDGYFQEQVHVNTQQPTPSRCMICMAKVDIPEKYDMESYLENIAAKCIAGKVHNVSQSWLDNPRNQFIINRILQIRGHHG